MLNIIVASKDGKLPRGLEHAGPHRLILDSTPGWAQSSNVMLGRAAALGGDALFLDDDVELTPSSLEGVHAQYDQADLFGLDLHDMEGKRQQGARHILQEDGAIVDWVHPGPAYVAHVSTSAMYIKHAALSLRFPVWPGVHWEDVAFCFGAWAKGFRVLAVPGYVHHAIVGGVGATKRTDAFFWQRWTANKQAFESWCADRDLSAVPIGVVMKKPNSTKMERPPAIVMDAENPVDPTQCQCTGVQRRWDGDGLIEPGKYRCSACGKWYA